MQLKGCLLQLRFRGGGGSSLQDVCHTSHSLVDKVEFVGKTFCINM